MRVSSENSRSPGLTVWPSLIWTVRTVLDTCGRTSTVDSAVTLPLAVTCSGTSPCCTRAVDTTTTAGALGAGLGANQVRHANQPSPAMTSSTATTAHGDTRPRPVPVAALQLLSTKPLGWSILSDFIFVWTLCTASSRHSP